MKIKRVLFPVLILALLLTQFVPGTMFSPTPVAAIACDQGEFVTDVTIPDGTTVTAGMAI
ncbi:MAG: hypothetical protein HGA79_01315, partial [Anaerolineales bacterium]|nr:hypothetical protein [Anaerolineales bacterium]